MKKTAFAVTAAAALATVGAVSTAPPAHAATHNCPTYYGCMYAGTSTSSKMIFEHKAYGTYELHNVLGKHLVVNSQTQGAYLTALDIHRKPLWTLQDGRSLPRSAVKNMTPVWYIKLSPGPSCWPRCV